MPMQWFASEDPLQHASPATNTSEEVSNVLRPLGCWTPRVTRTTQSHRGGMLSVGWPELSALVAGRDGTGIARVRVKRMQFSGKREEDEREVRDILKEVEVRTWEKVMVLVFF